jgi:hypothetical protein
MDSGMPDFASMPRRELQAVAKEHGIRANQKSVVIADQLSSLFLEKKAEKKVECDIPAQEEGLEIAVETPETPGKCVGDTQVCEAEESPVVTDVVETYSHASELVRMVSSGSAGKDGDNGSPADASVSSVVPKWACKGMEESELAPMNTSSSAAVSLSSSSSSSSSSFSSSSQLPSSVTVARKRWSQTPVKVRVQTEHAESEAAVLLLSPPRPVRTSLFESIGHEHAIESAATSLLESMEHDPITIDSAGTALVSDTGARVLTARASAAREMECEEEEERFLQELQSISHTETRALFDVSSAALEEKQESTSETHEEEEMCGAVVDMEPSLSLPVTPTQENTQHTHTYSFASDDEEVAAVEEVAPETVQMYPIEATTEPTHTHEAMLDSPRNERDTQNESNTRPTIIHRRGSLTESLGLHALESMHAELSIALQVDTEEQTALNDSFEVRRVCVCSVLFCLRVRVCIPL